MRLLIRRSSDELFGRNGCRGIRPVRGAFAAIFAAGSRDFLRADAPDEMSSHASAAQGSVWRSPIPFHSSAVLIMCRHVTEGGSAAPPGLPPPDGRARGVGRTPGFTDRPVPGVWGGPRASRGRRAPGPRGWGPGPGFKPSKKIQKIMAKLPPQKNETAFWCSGPGAHAKDRPAHTHTRRGAGVSAAICRKHQASTVPCPTALGRSHHGPRRCRTPTGAPQWWLTCWSFVEVNPLPVYKSSEERNGDSARFRGLLYNFIEDRNLRNLRV